MTEPQRLGEVVYVMKQHVLTTFLYARDGRARQAREPGKMCLRHPQLVAPLGHGSTKGDVDRIWLNHVVCLFQTQGNVNGMHTV